MNITTNIRKKAFVSIFSMFFSAIVVSILAGIYVLLIKQIEMMQIEAQSFQSLYVADSAFECLVYQEQVEMKQSGKSIFLPNAGSLDNCTGQDDMKWVNLPTAQPPNGLSVRAIGKANFSITTSQGEFCSVIDVNVETADSSQWTRPPEPNFLSVSGHNKSCADSTNQKVIERLIDFYF